MPSGLIAALLAPLFAALILGLAADGPGLARVLSRPGPVLLGEASYAMYLLHGPIWGWMEFVSQRFFDTDGYDEGIWFFALYCSLVVGVSVLAFLIVENPARRAVRRLLEGLLTRKPPARALSVPRLHPALASGLRNWRFHPASLFRQEDVSL